LRRAGAFISTTLPTLTSVCRDFLPAAGFRTLDMLLRRLTLLIALLVLVAAPSAHAAGLAATKKALQREMARAGAASGAYVVDLGTGTELYASKADVGRMPASVNKLYTTAGALLRYGADGRLTTSVLSAGLPDETGTINGNVVLRGGGDPTFNAASTTALAKQLTGAGLQRIEGRVIGDESAFDAFRGVPASGYRLTSEVGPLSALSYNHGRTGKAAPYYQASPATFTAQAFERALEKEGVKITGAARAGLTPEGMTPLSEYESPPVSAIVRLMNQPSDNYIAEMLIKGLGAQFGTAGSTTAGGTVIEEAVRPFGITPSVIDGSGLSRNDRTTPREVVQLLKSMDSSEAGVAFDESLAVAGRNGTLYSRMRGTAAQDRCHAKTGTLRDVSALAGFCNTTGGERVAFAFLMNRVNPSGARALQDRMTVALARYDAP
jgi:D-alanyl-D-alanine carboxypeptidase/D-alanyl-D-alanine-endopeptidase (penicillin-binding protein 4)